jgi:transposase
MAEQKARIIAESHAGGETVSSVARRHGLTPQQLFGWRRAARRYGDNGAGEVGSAFVPVVTEPASPRTDALSPRRDGCRFIEVVIGAATVRIPPGTDAMTLQTVLHAVKATT